VDFPKRADSKAPEAPHNVHDLHLKEGRKNLQAEQKKPRQAFFNVK
jgi:hypothetical protein